MARAARTGRTRRRVLNLLLVLAGMLGYAAPAQAVADLRIESVIYGAPPPGPIANQSFPVVVTVVNDGDEAAGPFSIAIWKNQPATPSDAATADVSKTVDGLAPGIGNHAVVKFYVTYDSPDTYPLQVWAGADHEVPDADDANNRYTALMTVTPNLPDLLIESIIPDTDHPVAGQPFDVAVTVKNQAHADAGAFHLPLWKDREVPTTDATGADMDAIVESVPAGQTEEIHLTVTYDSPGKYTFRVMADANHDQDEINEHNNTGAIFVTVEAASGNSASGLTSMCGRQGAENLPIFGAVSVLGLACMSLRRPARLPASPCGTDACRRHSRPQGRR